MKYSSDKGFTLIELLVAMAVMGLLVSLVTLSVGGQGGRDALMSRELTRVADALQARMQQASHEAVLRGEAVGLHILRDADQLHLVWSRWYGGRWFADLPALADNALPTELQLDLSVDGMPVPLMNALPQNRTPETALPVPALVFYPTGEASSFRLTLALENAALSARPTDPVQITVHNTRTGWLEQVPGLATASASEASVR
jgi:type II secretion system protein H